MIAYDPENITAVSRFREISDRVDNLTREEIDLRAGQIAFRQLLDKNLRVADSLFAEQKYESALIEYNKIIELDSANQHAHQRLSEIQEFYDDQFDQYVNDGERLLQQERYADAVLAFTEAQRIKPENTYIAGRISFAKQKLLLNQKLNDAVEYINSGDTARAQQLFMEVIVIDSTETIALDYLDRLEQAEKARPVTLEELKSDEEIWNIYLDGLRFFGEGQYREAIEKWQIVLEKYPGSVDAKENLRQAELRLQEENR